MAGPGGGAAAALTAPGRTATPAPAWTRTTAHRKGQPQQAEVGEGIETMEREGTAGRLGMVRRRRRLRPRPYRPSHTPHRAPGKKASGERRPHAPRRGGRPKSRSTRSALRPPGGGYETGRSSGIGPRAGAGHRFSNTTTLSRDAARPYLPICCALFPRRRTARISRQTSPARSPSSAVNSSTTMAFPPYRAFPTTRAIFAPSRPTLANSHRHRHMSRKYPRSMRCNRVSPRWPSSHSSISA